MQGKSSKETVTVEKEATKKLAMTDKVMKELQAKGQVDDDLGIVLPKIEESAAASDVKSEKPSLDKLLAASQKLKPSYLMNCRSFGTLISQKLPPTTYICCMMRH